MKDLLPRPAGPASIAELRMNRAQAMRDLEQAPLVFLNLESPETSQDRRIRAAREYLDSAADLRTAPRKFIDATWAGVAFLLRRDHGLEMPDPRELVGGAAIAYRRAHAAADAYYGVAASASGVAGPDLERAADAFQQACATLINEFAAASAAAKAAREAWERSPKW